MGKLASALLVIVGLSACTTPPLPEDHYYRLETDAPAATPQPPDRAAATLTVQRIRMTGVHGERPLLYSTATAPTELRQYHYHYWADNPERLIQEQLAAYLRVAGLAWSVNTPDNGVVSGDLQISGVVRHFEQRLDGSGARAIVEIELTLARKADGSTLLAKTYRADIASRDSTALAAAQGLSQALTQCFAQFVTDLRAINPPTTHRD